MYVCAHVYTQHIRRYVCIRLCMDGVWVPCACAVYVYINVCAVVCCVVSLCCFVSCVLCVVFLVVYKLY